MTCNPIPISNEDLSSINEKLPEGLTVSDGKLLVEAEVNIENFVGGDASAANQLTQITRLDTVISKLPGSTNTVASSADISTLNTTVSTSLGNVVTTIETTNTTLGSSTDAVATTDIGSFSLMSLVKRLLQHLTSISSTLTTKLPNLSSGRVPVEVASLSVTLDNATVEISNEVGDPIPVEAVNLDIRDLSSTTDSVAAVQSGTWNITDILGTITLPTGAATELSQLNTIDLVDSIKDRIPTGLTVTDNKLLVDAGELIIDPGALATEVTLESIDTKIPEGLTVNDGKLAVDIGTAVISGTGLAEQVTVYHIDTTIGSTEDSPAIDDDGESTLIGLIKRLLQRLTFLLPNDSNRLVVDGSQVTQPVSGTVDLGVTSISSIEEVRDRIPTGLTVTDDRLLVDIGTATIEATGIATEANQVTTNTILDSIDDKLPTGLTVSAGKLLVDAGSLTVDTTGLATETTLSSINTKLPSQGQALASASIPVVLPAAQITTLTPPTTVTANLGTLNGAATAANQTTANTSLASIDTKTPVLGAATAANSTPVTLANDGVFANNFGLQADAAATTDTGSFSLISLFKRLLQKLTSGLLISAFTVKSQTYLAGTVSTSGDTTIIAAPGAGLSIYITSLIFQLEATTPTTILIKSNTTTRKRFLCQNQGDGLNIQYSPSFEMKLGTNEPLVFTLSGANSVGYSIEYYVS